MSPPPQVSAEPEGSRLRRFWPPAVIAFAGVTAYANSLAGPFVFDDLDAVVGNPTIRHLGRIGIVLRAPASTVTGGRPVMNLSYALNYASGGLSVWGYHAVNLAIHILAGLTLYGIVRRTLRRSNGLAFAVALIWTVHPLQTEAVTYISERAESLMGLFYFLTLYAFIRKADAAARRVPTREAAECRFHLQGIGVWGWLSLAACLLGMATKEVMVTAPVAVLLYDRTFVSGTFREAWRRHGRYYAGLAASWLFLGWLMTGFHERIAGLDQTGNWWDYALTESRVIPRYLALSVWPHPLVFDYGSVAGHATWSAAPWVAAVFLLLGATVWALAKNFRIEKPGAALGTNSEVRFLRALGFAGAWVFLILAPTSSVVPLFAQPMAEHRMYLPLAGVVAVVVCGAYAAWDGLAGRSGILPLPPEATRRNAASTFIPPITLAIVAVTCVVLTRQRNATYASAESLWSDTVAKRPGNGRAHCSLGNALYAEGRTAEAMAEYGEALRLAPDDPEAYCDLGIALNAQGRAAEAIVQYEAALSLKPDFVEARCNLANALAAEGRMAEAIAQSEEALRLKPDYAEAHNNLGCELQVTPGRLNDAIAEYEQALRLKPDYAEAQLNLGNALNAAGRPTEAIEVFEQALRLAPDGAEAHYGLGNALIAAGLASDAISQYQEAVRLRPDYAEAHNNLGNALNAAGRVPEAIDHYQQALRLRPAAAVYLNLASALLKLPGRAGEAAAQLQSALQLDPGNAAARQLLDRIRAFPP